MVLQVSCWEITTREQEQRKLLKMFRTLKRFGRAASPPATRVRSINQVTPAGGWGPRLDSGFHKTTMAFSKKERFGGALLYQLSYSHKQRSNNKADASPGGCGWFCLKGMRYGSRGFWVTAMAPYMKLPLAVRCGARHHRGITLNSHRSMSCPRLSTGQSSWDAAPVLTASCSREARTGEGRL